ncbi:MAG: hypothetical protein AB7R55_22895 [Gemmatimonadales bacterium]
MTILILMVVTALPGQTVQRASSNAPFHKDPRGIQLGRLQSGIRYVTSGEQNGWIEATIEGYIWARSVAPTTRDGFDLAVTAGGGEVVRTEPNGTVVARLVEGTLLKRLASQGGWIKVQRTGWVARTGLAAEVAQSTPPPAPPPPAAGSDQPPLARAGDTASPPPPAGDTGSPPPAAVRADTGSAGGSSRVALRKGSEVATTPDGPRITALDRPSEVEVLSRSGAWIKVRLEGWVRTADVAGAAHDAPTLTGAMVRADPDRFVGQRIAWRLHFLAHQEGDDLRPEIPKGAPYLLTRGPLPETGFVYVMLSREQRDALEGLEPLDEIQIEGIIRAGRTRYLPTPVVELVRVVGR